jgi:hypothetical protein
MPLESATWVNQLDQTRPTSTDVKSEGDDVMRLIKSTLKNSFPNVGGAMNASQTELNRMVGATEDVQPRLSATLSAPNGETLNRLPASGSRLGGFLTFNASTGQPEVGFSLTAASGNSLGIFSVSNVTTFFTNGTERMRIGSDGRIGIGTSNPLSPLDVNGSVSVGRSAASQAIVVFNGDAVNAQQVRLAMSGTNALLEATRVSGTVPNMLFQIDGAERLRIGSNSNVGIGTAALTAKLNVFDAADNVEYMRAGASVEERGVRFRAFAVSAVNSVGHDINAPGASGSNGTLTLSTNSVERVRINASGDVISNVNTAAPTLTTNQQMVFALTSNTNLRISVRGTDGTTRVANITLA